MSRPSKWLVNLLLAAGLLGGGWYVLVQRPRVAAANPPAQVDIDWMAIEDDFSEHVVFNIVLPNKELRKDAYAVRVLEERFNVTLDYTTVDPSAYEKKKPLLLASGEIPDVFQESSQGLATAVKHGFVISVPLELVKKQAPAHVRLVNRIAPYGWQSGIVSGRNYAIPTIWLGARYPRVGLWRRDWLKALGIPDIPDTIPEYEEAFKRITEGDPDGDGERNTWGLTGDLGSWYMMFTEIFGAYGVMPFNWLVKDGELVWGGVQPESREALETLHRWYVKGYIHPDFVTDRWFKEINEKLFSGRIGYHNYMSSYEAFNPHDQTSAYRQMQELQPGAELAPTILPTGPRGQRGHRVWGAAHGTIVFGSTCTAQPLKVVRYLKMMQALITDRELFMQVALGEQGVHWQWADPAVGPGSGIVELPPYDTRDARLAEGLALAIFPESAPLIAGTISPESAEMLYPRDKVEFRRQFTPPEWGRPDALGRADIVADVAPIVTRLIERQQTRYAEFIVGERSLDEWNDWVAEWHRLGGQQALAATRDYYRATQATIERMKMPEDGDE